MREVIVCCPVRNELHNLTRLVPTWMTFAKHIVIADQNSWDGSREFLSELQNVHVIDNPDDDCVEHSRIQLMLKKARELSRSAVLVFLDADETLSANVLVSDEWTTFLRSPPGTTGYFPWVILWGSNKRFIARGQGAPAHHAFAFIDDGSPFESEIAMHGPRGPGMSNPRRLFFFNEVVNLHFFLTNPVVYRKKQNWYKMLWIKKGGKYFHTNRNHNLYEDVDIGRTDTCPQEWTSRYVEFGLDLSSAECSALLWYDVEILRHLKNFGCRALWFADIWNQDWEHCRQLAVAGGHTGIPEEPVEPPPSWARKYNDLVLGRVKLGRILRSAMRYSKRKLLP